MKFATLLTTALLAAAVSPAFAQNTATPKIDARQQAQEKRIDNGVKTGELTAKETSALVPS